MARKKQNKQSPNKRATASPEKSEPVSANSYIGWFQHKNAVALVFLVGFLLYANTFSHEYVLDDKIVITHNQITKTGLKGMFDHFFYDSMNGFWAHNYGVDVKDLEDKNLVSGGRYRPVTMLTHSIEYGLFDESPGISHFINTILYGATGFLLFVFLQLLFPIKDQKWFWNVPFLTAMLFALHPLHTEVVANIKGRDEILSFLFVLLALIQFVQFIQNKGQSKFLFWSAVFFGLALFSKETAIPFVILLPLTAITFLKKKWKEVLIPTAAFAGVAAFYLVVRFSVLGWDSSDTPTELMNNPFVRATEGEKWATVVLSFLVYLKLLVFPHPLTHDYYPFHLPFLEPEVEYAQWSDPLVFVSLITLLALVLFTTWKGFFTRSILGYGLAWFLGTLFLVSNVLFPVGVFMNERFLYIPSAGLILVGTVYLLQWVPTIKDKNFKPVALLLLAVGVGFVYKTVDRNAAWKSDKSLALTDVEISKGSAKIKMSAAIQLMQSAENLAMAQREPIYREAIEHLQKSAEIHPTYSQALILLGKAHYQLKEYGASNYYFLRLAAANASFENRAALSFTVLNSRKLMEAGQIQSAVETLQSVREYYPTATEPLTVLGEAYGRYLNQPQESEAFLLKALELSPNNPDALMNLGTLYAQQKQIIKARSYFERAMRLVPNNMVLLQNLAAIYAQQGEQQKYQTYLKRIEQLKQGKN